jgi:hypothetical protein
MASKKALKGRIKGKRDTRSGKKPKPAVKGRSGAARKKAGHVRAAIQKKLPVDSRSIVIVYGMKLDPEIITRAAIDAYNKRRYTVHDIRLIEYIPDPKFRNLMVRIAVLDRIEEEVRRVYPDANVMRPNTVTLMVR